MNRIRTLDDFIKKANHIYKNRYDYTKTIYIKSNIKINIICKIHGEFLQLPSNHLKGSGCKKCGIEDRRKEKTLTQEEFIKKVNEKWSEYVDLSKTIYINSSSNILVICKKCNSEYNVIAGKLLYSNGHGCNMCNGGGKPNRILFIKKAKLVHGDKYDYSLVKYINAHIKIKIKCNLNHIFEQKPYKHLSGQGCSKCVGRNKTQEEFINLSKNKYGDAFDYSNVNYIDMRTPIILICKNNHKISVSPDYHLSKDSSGGCRECQYLNISKNLTYTQDEWIKLANIRHNHKYNYSKVNYISSFNEVCIICPKHGEFNQISSTHLQGHGCKKCFIKYSKLQIQCLIYYQISLGFIQHSQNIGEYRIPNTQYSADGYNNISNTIIEFHGDFWHGNPKIYNKDDINPKTLTSYGELYQKTIKRTEYIKNMGYNVIEIWENEWNKGIKAIKIIQKKFRSCK